MRRLIWIPLVLTVLASPAHANLVVNPGFETCSSGQAANWDPSTVNPSGFLCSPPSHGGTFAAHMVGQGSLGQTILTIPGQSYEFSFWLQGTGGGDPSNSFTATFGTTAAIALHNTTLPAYTLEDFTVTATQANTRIVFDGFNSTGTWSLDDVSVTEIPAPEPASLSLLAGGLIGLWSVRRRCGIT